MRIAVVGTKIVCRPQILLSARKRRSGIALVALKLIQQRLIELHVWPLDVNLCFRVFKLPACPDRFAYSFSCLFVC